MHKVSIIVPAHNSEYSIKACIDSLLRQSHKNTEIIVIDDCSTDNTRECLSSYHGRIKTIFNNDNLGVSASRNIGIKAATGEFVMFCDSDDTYNEKAVEQLLEAAITKKVNIVRSNIQVIRQGEKRAQDMRDVSNQILNYRDNKNQLDKVFFAEGKMPCFVMALFIKRSLLIGQSIFFDEELSLMEDTVFYARLFSTGERILFYNLVTYNYYVNKDSITHSSEYYEKNIKRIIDANKKLKSIVGDNAEIDKRHFKFCVHYIANYYKSFNRVPDLGPASVMAAKTRFGFRDMFWGLVRRGVIKNAYYLPALLRLYIKHNSSRDV